MDPRIKEAIFRQVEQEPFGGKFRLKLLELDEGYAKMEMTLAEDMKNFLGYIHGGAIFALMDGAFGAASNSYGTLALALNMSVQFLAAPALGEKLVAEAKEFSRTKRIAHYDIRVVNEQGQLVACSQGLVYRKGDPLSFL